MNIVSDVENLVALEAVRLGIETTQEDVWNIIQTILWVLPENIPPQNLVYLVSYWTQALLKKPTTKLRLDNPEQVFYPVEDILIPFTQYQTINQILSYIPTRFLLCYLVQNLPDILLQISSVIDEVQCIRSQGNLIVLSNHASWMNLPLLAVFLNLYAWVPKDKIHTLLWPAITTRALSYAGIVNFSNLLKTVPDTKNGNIEAKKIIKTIRFSMFREVEKIFLTSENIGNIFLIAPSGTTDTFLNGKFLLEKPSPGTNAFVSRLAENNRNSFVSIGINDKQIMPDNSAPKRGNAFVSMSHIASWKESAQILLDSLPQHVIDHRGHTIWQRKS
jgi:hypothetical protein